jgi:diguanylate cyclase (GGDEF)-like protein
LKESSNQKNKFNRESIIGLGEDSFRKNYYPELQKKIIDLEKINARNRTIIRTIPDIMLISDAKGNIYPYNYSLSNKSPYVEIIMRDDKIRKLLVDSVLQVVASGVMSSVQFAFKYENSNRFFEARINISETHELLIMIRDITEQKLLEHKLREMADSDSLTGLSNRRVFEEYIHIINNKRIEKVSVLVLDIDGLKLLNDTLGHQQGDEVIRITARLIEEVFGNADLTSRLSGDEFGIIQIGLSAKSIEDKMVQFNDKVNSINKASEKLRVSISYGYGYHDSGVVNTDLLFKEADNNMYQNKMFKTSSVRSSLVKTLMKALEARDFITEGHADRLEDLTVIIGRELGLAQNKIDNLKLLAKFHDIGKVGIPDNILNKPDKLTDAEYRIMKTHSQIGRRIAEESVNLKTIANLIYHHHERWDGKGYPEGLIGTEIPIECRILAIVDTFDAMTNDRPYRKALPSSVAVEEIVKNAGHQFDPQLVDVFLSTFKA